MINKCVKIGNLWLGLAGGPDGPIICPHITAVDIDNKDTIHLIMITIIMIMIRIILAWLTMI